MSRPQRPTVMDKEQLAAFADGELSPEEAAAVVLHLADHPQDQAWVDDLNAANVALLRAFAQPQEVPERFRALIMDEPLAQSIPESTTAETGTVVRFRPRLRQITMGITALAAALTGVALLLPSPSEPDRLAAGPVAPASTLSQILSEQPSGVAVEFAGGQMMVLSSLPVRDGYCREIELSGQPGNTLTQALACDTGGGWAVDIAVSEALPAQETGEDYMPASGTAADSFGRWLETRDAGLALTPAQEADLIRSRWGSTAP